MTKDSITFKDDGSVEAVLPKALYLSVVKIQADEGVGWNEACRNAAELIDSGSEKFNTQVKGEARKLHNSELMIQLNKARSKIEANALERGKGFAKIRYPCSVCGKDLVWNLLDPEGKKQIMGILVNGGIGNWYHATCKAPTE